MTEDPSYELPLDVNNLLNSTARDAIASDLEDFNKYDRYIEKIKTLFVPSLEPRIYSCLETFVYLQDSVNHSDSSYLKRCLNVAATWRDPVEEFCTKWRNTAFLEKMITNAVKFLIRDGLINCFLDSIVLNNRLNRVCRNLDALGVDKDLTRYLAAWNYINERDYWLYDDKKISTSMSDQNYDSMDRHSDLNVEVGSILGGRRNGRSFKRAIKRRVSDDFSEDPNKNDAASHIVREKEEIRDRFPSRLSIDSSNLEGSRCSSARRKIRSCQAYPCRPSTCTSYRMKNVVSGDWKGKTLKLQLSKIPLGASEYERELVKPSRLSKLFLPCKFDDLISKIVKIDSDISLPVRQKKKFFARVTSLCSRVNEILGKIDKKIVARCRLHCEVLPECVNFRLIKRESDGCKVCLFSDRVTINRIDRPNVSKAFSSNNLKHINETKIPEEVKFTVHENTGFDPVEDESQMRTFVEEPEVAKPVGEILLRLSDDDLQACKEKNSESLGRKDSLNVVSEFKIEKLTCDCNTMELFSHSVNDAVQNNYENINRESGETTKELIKNESLVRVNSTKGLTGKESLNQLNSMKKLIDDESLNRLPKNRSNSVAEKVVQVAKNERKFETTSEVDVPQTHCKVTLNSSNENVFVQQTCDCNNSVDDGLNVLNYEIEENYDIGVRNNQICGASDFIADLNKNKKITDTIVKDGAEIDLTSKLQQDSTSSSTTLKSESDAKTVNQVDNNACACPSDCTCPNKSIEYDQSEKCDSRCSCDSCGEPIHPASVKKTEVIRMSSLLKPVGRHSTNPEVQDSHKSTSTQSNEVSALKSDELQPSFIKAQVESFQSRDLEFSNEKSINPAISLESNVIRPKSSIEDEPKARHVPLPAIRLPRSIVNESPKKLSIEEQPIVSARFSKPKGQRINISIEMCSDSESSKDEFLKVNYNDDNKLKDDKDVPLLRKSRCHSIEMQDFRKQALPHHDKNTNDECLRRPRGIDARVHLTPRSLESRDSVAPSGSSSSMRNPFVYRMSSKSGIRSTRTIERRSIDRENRHGNDKLSYETRDICNGRRNPCRSMERKKRVDRRVETEKRVPRMTIKTETFSPFNIQNNLCHAFSASSIDRMKHLIRTKLRRILLERDKATNTSRMTLTNKKYRVSVPNGKTDRSRFGQQRCRTIWESRSASDSTRTSRSFVSNDRITSNGFCHREEAKIFISRKKFKDLPTESRPIERHGRVYDKINLKNDCTKNSETSSRNSRRNFTTDVNLNTNFRRLAGGSDIPYRKCIEDEVTSKRISRKSTKKCAIREDRSVVQNKNCRFEEKFELKKTTNNCCKENSEESGDSTATRSHKNVQKKILDEFAECSGKLDCSGNSTSRHIYLYEFDRFASSCDETESPFCERENSRSPPKYCSADERSGSRGGQRVCRKNVNNPRPHVPSVSRNNCTTNNFSLKTKRHEGFGKLDRDLRNKLSQYVSLCKSVKYSLLKRLRPDDIYEVSRTSIPCCDRYKFGDS